MSHSQVQVRSVYRAAANRFMLQQERFPGSMVVAGIDESGQYVVMATAIFGHEALMRGMLLRRYIPAREKSVRVELIEPDTKADPSLFYTAMQEHQRRIFVAGNGHHVRSVFDVMASGGSFEAGHQGWHYINDAPKTPRITAAWKRSDGHVRLSFATRHVRGGALWRFEGLHPGTGYCLPAYRGWDDGPLPYTEGPFLLALTGELESATCQLWGMLNQDTRVGLAVKFIEIETGESSTMLCNRHSDD